MITHTITTYTQSHIVGNVQMCSVLTPVIKREREREEREMCVLSIRVHFITVVRYVHYTTEVAQSANSPQQKGSHKKRKSGLVVGMKGVFVQNDRGLTSLTGSASGLNVLLYITRVLEGQLLPRHLVHYAFTVVVPEASAEFVVVHLWLVLACTP